jgi:hypothetical protein
MTFLQVVYSCCVNGVICCWTLSDGRLLHQIDQIVGEAPELACTDSRLLGYNGELWIWDKKTLQLETRITPDDDGANKVMGGCYHQRILIVLNDDLAASSNGDRLIFWDLRYKAPMIRQTRRIGNGGIDQLVALDARSVIVSCRSDGEIYRFNVPMLRSS